MKKESDDGSRKRLEKLSGELDGLEKKSADLTAIWQAEKEKIADSQKIKEALDQARIELEQAQRTGDLARASEIKYGRIPELEAGLRDRDEAENRMLNEEVGAEAIAAVVSRWTGHPGRQDAGRRARKASQNGSGDPDPRGRPGRGGPGRRQRRAAGLAPACRIRNGRSAASCSSGRPASARRS